MADQVRKGRKLPTNLIHFCRPVQQLLVRVIFLPGISDGGKAMCHLTSRFANHLRMRGVVSEELESSGPRHTHLPYRQALARTLEKTWIRVRRHHGIPGPSK